MRGEMEAPTRDAVIVRLRAQRIQPFPAKIKEKGKGSIGDQHPAFGETGQARDIVIFTRQLATMIDAGLPIVQCLDILAAQTDDKTLRKAIREIKEEVEAGSTFTDALRKHPKIFDDLYVNMVAAGEIGGILDTILNRLAVYMEKAMRLKTQDQRRDDLSGLASSRSRSASPAILLIFVIPVFAELFSQLRPGAAGADAVRHQPLELHRSTTSGSSSRDRHRRSACSHVALANRARPATRIDRLLLQLADLRRPDPQVGDRALHAHARHAGLLRRADPRRADDHGAHRRQQGRRAGHPRHPARASARARRSPSRSIESKVFPPMVCQMIAVGETTGALDAMLQKIADFYEDEVDNAVANLTALMEPMVILFLGVVIGGLVISMYLPIFKLGSVISQ